MKTSWERFLAQGQTMGQEKGRRRVALGVSLAWLLSDVQNSWVGTLAEPAPGGCTAGNTAISFQCSEGYDVTSGSETCQ